MALLQSLQLLHEYEMWALRRVMAALGATVTDGTAVGTYAHILNAYQIWHDRINGIADTCEPWQPRSVEECETLLVEIDRQYRGMLQAIGPADLETPIDYRNTKGQPYTTALQDILLHVALHSAYHRGQVNAAIRKAGGQPAVVDFVVFDRDP